MRLLQRREQTDSDDHVVDLTVHEEPAVDRGEAWATVLAFTVAGTLIIAAILVLWATAPIIGA